MLLIPIPATEEKQTWSWGYLVPLAPVLPLQPQTPPSEASVQPGGGTGTVPSFLLPLLGASSPPTQGDTVQAFPSCGAAHEDFTLPG